MMHEAVFLNDTSNVSTINLINDQEFIALYQEVIKPEDILSIPRNKLKETS